jgi:putative transposase
MRATVHMVAIQAIQIGDQASLQKARFVIEKMKTTKLSAAARTVEEGISETLTYTEFPREHWLKIRTNNPMEQVMRSWAIFPMATPL